MVNPTQGTWCLDSGINPASGAACANPGTYQPSGPRGTTRDTRNGLAYNQTDLTSRFATGSIGHSLVAGVSFLHETYDLDNGNMKVQVDFRSVYGTVLKNWLGADPTPVVGEGFPTLDFVR